MTLPEPLNASNFDKETQDKIAKIAQSQGMSLNDFLNDLIATKKNTPQDIKNAVQKNNFEKTEPISNINKLQHENTTLRQTKKISLNRKKIPLESEQAPKAIANKPIKTANTAKKSTVKKSVKKVMPKKPENDLFYKLTNKIGIQKPVLSEVTDSNISDTILRERQLRDFMRIQMTEMRDVMGAMFEKKIDTKLQQFACIIDENTGNPVIQQAIIPEFDTSDLLKAHDFTTQFMSFSDLIQKNISEILNTELTKKIDTMFAKSGEQYQFIIDNIQNINDSILENVDTHITNVIQRTLATELEKSLPYNLSESTDIQNGLSSVTAVHSDIKELFNRMGHIETIYSSLDNKLSTMNKDLNNATFDDVYIKNIENIKTDITTYMQSVPHYMEKLLPALEKQTDIAMENSNIATQNILNHIRTALERILKLEATVKKILAVQKLQSDPARGVHNIHDDDDDDDNQMNYDDEQDDDTETDINKILQKNNELFNNAQTQANFMKNVDWDENDNQSNRKNNFLSKMQSYESEEDDEDEVRSFDRKAIAKDIKAKRNTEISAQPKKSLIKNLFGLSKK